MLIETVKKCKYKSSYFGAFALICAVFLLLSSPSLYGQKKTYTVVIDAGHGGRDPGGVSNGYREKDVALKVSLLLGKQLGKNENLKVIFTRKKDVFLGLWERGKIANRAKADLFISIHCNTVDNSSAYGTETFVLGLHRSARNLEVVKKENAVILLEDDYQKRYKKFDPNSPESIVGLTLMQEENLDKSFALASEVQKNFKNDLKRRDRGV